MSMQNPIEEQLRWQLKIAREALERMVHVTEPSNVATISERAKARLNAKRVLKLTK